MLYRSVAQDEKARRFLTWRWRVDQTMPPTDLSRQGGDDRPLAVHLWFPLPDERADFWDRLKTPLQRLFTDLPVNGQVLTYVWGGKGDRGEKILNPFLDGRGMMIILRDGTTETGQWFDEKIDFASDFRMAFGFAAPLPEALAVSGDADDSQGRSLGVVAHLAFADE